MSFTERNLSGVVCVTADNITARHGFTTRFGGVSTGIFESLNLGENRGDDPDLVRENFRRMGRALGIDPEAMAFSRQVHGNQVRIVTEKDRRSLFQPIEYEADGLVTNVRGLPIIIFTADCVPVLLHDPAAGVIGAVHCGWRSSVMDILGAAVGKMASLGARPENIRAAIGPAIDKCCFETGPEVPEAVEKYLSCDTEGLYWPRPGVPGKFMVDLKGANRHRLIQLGLKPENISVSQECTVCRADKYWSHRATKGRRGSQAAVICLD
ncbi:MAG: peptidoglycan editing factor PgeF [Oscillospiraceae bacterium]|jgi:YfiH family protein